MLTILLNALKKKENEKLAELRTVNGPRIPEKTILQAYQALRLAVYGKKFQIQVQMDNQEMLYYLAVDTSVEFGAAKPTIMPKISGQISYTQEVVIPNLNQVYVSKVWYDSSLKLARYDYHDSKGVPPFYSINPMTIIHDFSTVRLESMRIFRRIIPI
ncbi:Hypothetical predicted protein [Mytilus galloprovincialis]|uniref:LolA-like domain-containing protein n=1 Tax=Mytilus galloprovincialis TaxID=29158 RepID=A0A8B6BTZ7_MYTGA|nr:Hypothetical predicted protein [Mytilus galloprovincialis]